MKGAKHNVICGVCACLLDFVKGIVLLERKSILHPTEPGALMFPGGAVDFGETDIVALCRELNEECGIDQSNLMFKMLQSELGISYNQFADVNMKTYVALNWNGNWSSNNGCQIESIAISTAIEDLDLRRRNLLLRAINTADEFRGSK
jgi:8-oxo-dGTP pyrophosphatase MutT (NUDIX family)